MKIVSAFSLSMFLRAVGDNALVSFRMIDEKAASKLLEEQGIDSCIGHQATASFLTQKLKKKILFNRKIVKLRRGEEMLLSVPDLFTVKDLYGQMRIPDDVKEFTEEEVEVLRFQYILVKRLDKKNNNNNNEKIFPV